MCDGSSHTFKKLIWKAPECFLKNELTSTIRKWLLFPGSFTQKVQLLGDNEPLRIRVLSEDVETVRSGSYELSSCRFAFVREVKIYMGDDLIMYAKSWLPKDTATFYKRAFRELGQKPLGALLFSSNNIRRSSFEVAKILPSHELYHQAGAILAPQLWGRRSIFFMGEDRLLLLEVFCEDLLRRIHVHKDYCT